MKLVQDLPEIFEEFGEKRREAFLEVKEDKDKGVPVVLQSRINARFFTSQI